MTAPGSALCRVLMTLVATSALALGACSAPTRTDTVVSNADMPVGLSYGNRLLSLSGDELDDALDDAVALHTPWIRIDLSWADLQPTSATSFSWRRTDRVIERAHDRGLRVLGIVTYTPSWARAPGCDSFTCPPADYDDFARFAGAVADRYAGRVQALEVWNEPNLAMFWRDPDPVAYRNLLARTTAAIREADPDATVLLGGLAALPSDGTTIDAAEFLRSACERGRCDVDAVAYHPYTFPRLPSDTSAPESSWRRMLDARADGDGVVAALQATGLADTPIWVTEFGAPTGGEREGTDHVSEAQQARIVLDALRAAGASSDVVGGLFLYTWKDSTRYGSNEDHFGLLRADGSHKPAYTVVRRALSPEKPQQP